MKPTFLLPATAACALVFLALARPSSTAGPAVDGDVGHAFAVTSGNLEAVLASEKPVLIDFWAEWCGPCKLIAPHVESTAKKYKGKVVVGKVDVDSQPELAKRYNIQGIPNLKIIKDGKVVEDIVGYISEEEIAARLDKHLMAAE